MVRFSPGCNCCSPGCTNPTSCSACSDSGVDPTVNVFVELSGLAPEIDWHFNGKTFELLHSGETSCCTWYFTDSQVIDPDPFIGYWEEWHVEVFFEGSVLRAFMNRYSNFDNSRFYSIYANFNATETFPCQSHDYDGWEFLQYTVETPGNPFPPPAPFPTGNEYARSYV